MTKRHWSLVALMILLNYLIYTQLFNLLTKNSLPIAAVTPTLEVTFTPTTTLEAPVLVPATPNPESEEDLGPPTATATLVLLSTEQAKAATATVGAAAQKQAPPQPNADTQPATNPTPIPAAANTTPRVTAASSAVNLRLGPGVNYQTSGALLQGQSLVIVGRNASATWWQVQTANGLRWISARVTSTANTGDNVPVVQAPAPPPPPPKPTNPPAPAPVAPPSQPQQQYTIHNIFGQINEAITQIRGEIKDSAGNPVNGIRVRVRSGTFCIVSNPSGPPGRYPNGNYDILLDNRAKPGQWQVAIVNGPGDPEDNQCNDGLRVLSEEVTVPTDNREGVVFIEWRKNF